MRWWIVGVFASVARVTLVVVTAGVVISSISAYFVTPKPADPWNEKVILVSGVLLVLGLFAVWAHAFKRRTDA